MNKQEMLEYLNLHYGIKSEEELLEAYKKIRIDISPFTAAVPKANNIGSINGNSEAGRTYVQ